MGGGSLVAGLAPRLGQLWGCPPAPPTPLRSDGSAGGRGAVCWDLWHGVTRRRCALTADLLAEEVRRAQQVRQRRRNAWMGAAVALVVLIGGCAAAHQRWRDHLDSSGHGQPRCVSWRQSAPGQRSWMPGTRANGAKENHRRALRPNPPWVDVMDALAMAAPQGVWVTGIELSEGRPLVIRGTALRQPGAAQFTNALMGPPLLEQVQLSFANGLRWADGR